MCLLRDLFDWLFIEINGRMACVLDFTWENNFLGLFLNLQKVEDQDYVTIHFGWKYQQMKTRKVVSTVPKNNLMIVLPYLGKRSLQIPTRINRVMKKNSPAAIFELYSRITASWSIFSHLDKIHVFLRSGILITLSAVAAMLPIMTKLSAILKSECVNTLDFLMLLEKEWKGIAILP